MEGEDRRGISFDGLVVKGCGNGGCRGADGCPLMLFFWAWRRSARTSSSVGQM